MDWILQIYKNVVMFVNNEWVTVRWTYLLYENIAENHMLQPAEGAENYILSTSSDIVNLNKIKMDIYFFQSAIGMSSYGTDIGIMHNVLLF